MSSQQSQYRVRLGGLDQDNEIRNQEMRQRPGDADSADTEDIPQHDPEHTPDRNSIVN